MRTLSVIFLCVFLSPLGLADALAENWSNIGKFEDWVVYGYESEFEGERRFEVFSAIRNSEMRHVGIIKLGQREFSPGNISGTSVYFKIENSVGAWPDCDYDFLKYKIDVTESAYWPSQSGQCNSHYANKALIGKMKSGDFLRLKHKNGVSSLSLSGFTKAWEAARAYLKRR